MRNLLLPILFLVFITVARAAVIVGEKLPSPVVKVAPDHPAKASIEAYNKGAFAEAVRLAKPLAEAKNPEALLIMGLAYEGGRGVLASREKAIEFYRSALLEGNKQAAYRLPTLLVDTGDEKFQKEAQVMLEGLAKSDEGMAARMLGEGALRGWFGAEPNFDEARQWWSKSSVKGDVPSMLSLGRLLDGGLGFPEKRDPAAALAQFIKAAELGNADAMVGAGSRLLRGDQSILNEEKGREWLGKAIEEKQRDAFLVLGDFEQTVKDDKKAALAAYRKGAEMGQSACMVNLAGYLLAGAGGAEKDPAGALVLLKKAGEAGNPLGHIQAARLLLKEEDQANVLEGYAHLIAAAEGGLGVAQNEVGLLYLSGRLGIRDSTAAASWFSRASAGGLVRSTINLATLYERGLGVPQDYARAGRLYTHAANLGSPQATAAVARFNARGLGTPQNLPKAWAMFSLATEMGHEAAKKPLAELTALLSPKQIDEGQKVLAGFKKAAKENAKGNVKESPKKK